MPVIGSPKYIRNLTARTAENFTEEDNLIVGSTFIYKITPLEFAKNLFRKVIDTLNTNNKTVEGAINELHAGQIKVAKFTSGSFGATTSGVDVVVQLTGLQGKEIIGYIPVGKGGAGMYASVYTSGTNDTQCTLKVVSSSNTSNNRTIDVYVLYI